jgi:tRNA(Arg) A34 adenosine deaminase TadA
MASRHGCSGRACSAQACLLCNRQDDTKMAFTSSETSSGADQMIRSIYRTHDPACYDTATAKDQRWIQRTLILASTSQHSYRMGALALHGGRVVAQAVNRRRNPPTAVPWVHCSFHAEAGLLRVRPDLSNCTVYIARLTTAGHSALARPCTDCHTLLSDAGVRRTVWTASITTIGVETFR